MGSRGAPGEVLVPGGVPSGAPGHDFGPPRAPFWFHFEVFFQHVLAYFLETISASFLDTVLDAFGVHF